MNFFDAVDLQAVQVLLASRDLMNSKKPNVEAASSTAERSKQNVDPIQVSSIIFLSSITLKFMQAPVWLDRH